MDTRLRTQENRSKVTREEKMIEKSEKVLREDCKSQISYTHNRIESWFFSFPRYLYNILIQCFLKTVVWKRYKWHKMTSSLFCFQLIQACNAKKMPGYLSDIFLTYWKNLGWKCSFLLAFFYKYSEFTINSNITFIRFVFSWIFIFNREYYPCKNMGLIQEITVWHQNITIITQEYNRSVVS